MRIVTHVVAGTFGLLLGGICLVILTLVMALFATALRLGDAYMIIGWTLFAGIFAFSAAVAIAGYVYMMGIIHQKLAGNKPPDSGIAP